MPYIRKARAGNDSYGNVWPADGAVIEVAPEHAQALLAIADAGFAEVAPPTSAPDPDEPSGDAVNEAPKPRRGRPPKATSIEE